MESQYRQMTIFDMMGQEPPPSVAASAGKSARKRTAPQSSTPKKQEHREDGAKRGLSDWCFLYTAGRAGRNSGIRFMMTREDAMAWCESDVSKGILHGHPWAYFFTSVENFCNCHWGQLRGAVLDLRKLEDNGQWDGKIEALHLRKYGKKEIKQILATYGIEVRV